jgi:hypothetical protein
LQIWWKAHIQLWKQWWSRFVATCKQLQSTVDMLNDAQGHCSEMPVTSVLINVHQDTQTLLLNQAKVCNSANPILQTLFVTLYTAYCSSLFLRSQPKNLSYQECLDQKQNNTYVPVANDLQFIWPRRPRLNPRLRWKVSPSMLLSAPKVTAVHPRMVPWFLGGVAEEWTDSVHFRPRLKDLFLTHGSTTRVPRNIQVGWREWIEEEMIRELNSPRSCRWSMETIFQYFSLLNSLERCSFEWWQQRRQRGKISDGRRESAVRLLPRVLLSLLQPGWGLIEAAESLTSRRTQEQILL